MLSSLVVGIALMLRLVGVEGNRQGQLRSLGMEPWQKEFLGLGIRGQTPNSVARRGTQPGLRFRHFVTSTYANPGWLRDYS